MMKTTQAVILGGGRVYCIFTKGKAAHTVIKNMEPGTKMPT